MIYKEIGQRIKDERSKFGWTQQEFAEIVGLSTIFVGQIERGERKMSLDTLIKVSNSLHVSLDYLIKGESSGLKQQAANQLSEFIDRCSGKELALISDIIKAVLPHTK